MNKCKFLGANAPYHDYHSMIGDPLKVSIAYNYENIWINSNDVWKEEGNVLHTFRNDMEEGKR